MKTLFEIVEDVKDGKKPEYEEIPEYQKFRKLGNKLFHKAVKKVERENT